MSCKGAKKYQLQRLAEYFTRTKQSYRPNMRLLTRLLCTKTCVDIVSQAYLLVCLVSKKYKLNSPTIITFFTCTLNKNACNNFMTMFSQVLVVCRYYELPAYCAAMPNF